MQREIEKQKELRKESEGMNKKYEFQLRELEGFIEYLHGELNATKQENYRIGGENCKILADFERGNKMSSEMIRSKVEAIELLKKQFAEEIQNREKIVKDVQEKCESLGKEAKILRIENEKLKNDIKALEETQKEKEKIEESNIKDVQKMRIQLKKKYREKEEKLKGEINSNIEEIQKTVIQNAAECAKTKKENLFYQSNLKELTQELQEKDILLETHAKKALDDKNLNEFIKEKLSITENSLKSEIQKFSELKRQHEDYQSSQKSLISSLHKKISEKSSQIDILSKQISEIERKSTRGFKEFIEKESDFSITIAKLEEEHLMEVSQLKTLNGELENKLKSLEKCLEHKVKDLKKTVSDKKTLKKIIADLEISVKHLDIQQTRQSLEELTILKKKLSQESSEKFIIEAKNAELLKEITILQQKINLESQIFRLETSRKDSDFMKLKGYVDSKVKEKTAENAIFLEEIRTELVSVLGELLSNEISLECCETLEQIIKSLN